MKITLKQTALRVPTYFSRFREQSKKDLFSALTESYIDIVHLLSDLKGMREPLPWLT